LFIEWDILSLLANIGIEFRLEGNHVKVNDVAEIDRATGSDLAFCWYTGEKGKACIVNSKAGIILCRNEMQGIVHPSLTQLLIFTENPRLAFIKILNKMQGKKRPIGISSKAIISKNARIGSDCYIGDYTVIGDNCIIADNTLIYDRVSLVQNCIIGSNCVIQSGVVIGSDGFAFERYSTGELEKFPHRGYVKIGNNVEIYANSSIARGSLSDTVIGDGTKIDALVHVAHNVIVGENCEFTAGTIIGGSTIIGNSCWTGLNCTLKNKIKLGDNVLVASGASVIHDVPDGDIVAGVPAKSIKDKVKTDELFLMAGQKPREQENRKTFSMA
jgi:UDP-3-O-[3-hydroxymyristoyl] glucosamine N-acyltransferase